MLGVLLFERGREPLQFADIPALLWMWFQAIGPFTLLGLFLLLGFHFRIGPFVFHLRGGGSLFTHKWMRPMVKICLLLVFLGEAVRIYFMTREASAANLANLPGALFYNKAGQIAGFVAGLAGLVGVGVPFLSGSLGLSWRRIWALTKLSFMEGIRRRILYVFSALLVVLMFASWFISTKPEDQLKTYVQVLDLAMTPLLLFAGVLVAAFSIPNDIRQQTIHTILTKPVERFEVILGRFLGYAGLMTLILLALNLVGVLYVLRGIDPDAAAESLKARVPWYGTLAFEDARGGRSARADSVGREWDYRSYISGPMGGDTPPPVAVWSFPEPSSSLAGRTTVQCEFAFDIYRTTKGRENQGVQCSMTFTTWRYNKDNDRAIAARRKALEDQKAADPDATIAEEFGIYIVRSKTVIDYHTETLELPGGLFRNAIPRDAAERKEMDELAKKGIAPLSIKVRCDSPTQYLGMERYDLYMRQDNPEGTADRLWFTLNFFKSAFGLWLRLCLVIGLAVCLSTYLTGVVSLLIALLIYMGGVFREFISTVALGTNIGGGPIESLIRLTTRTNVTAPLEQTVSTGVAQGLDRGFRVSIQTVMNMLPDLDRYDMTTYVAEGFDIPLATLVINFLVLLGYLLPWFVLAYYMLRQREIAGSE